MGLDAMTLVFFKPTFSLSSFTFIKRLYSSSLLSALRMVLSAYLRLLIFLPAVLSPACALPHLAYCMIYCAFKLNKQGTIYCLVIFWNIYFCFIDYAKAFDCWITTNCGKFLEVGILDYLTCLLRNLYAGQEATARHRTTQWFKIGKGVNQGCILSPCLFNVQFRVI